MDINNIASVIMNIGFPIVMCGAMGLFVKYMYDKDAAERDKLNENHEKEMDKIAEALNNNTIAITKLCEKLEDV